MIRTDSPTLTAVRRLAGRIGPRLGQRPHLPRLCPARHQHGRARPNIERLLPRGGIEGDLERAQARKTPWDERITYREIDATDEVALLTLSSLLMTVALTLNQAQIALHHQRQTGWPWGVATAAFLAIVTTNTTWIEANLKETDLAQVRVGQPVRIRIDTYGRRDWRGHVVSISQATGAEFAILPAQNASGNWIKVVQRIPVRIAVDEHAGDPPLRAGMSAWVEVDTGGASDTQRAVAP